MSTTTSGSRRLHHLLLLALVACLTVTLTPWQATAGAAEPFDGYVYTRPWTIRPDVPSPTVELIAVDEADHGPADLFVPGATVTLVEGGIEHSTEPLTVVAPDRATFTTAGVPAGDYELAISSGGTEATSYLEVRAPFPGEELYGYAQGPGRWGELGPTTTEFGATFDEAFLTAPLTLEHATFYDWWDGTEEDVTDQVEVTFVDAARVQVTLEEPFTTSGELQISMTTSEGLTATLWAEVSGPVVYAEPWRLLAGTTNGRELRLLGDFTEFDSATTVRLLTAGRALPADPLGTPIVVGPEELRVPIQAELPRGEYELRITTADDELHTYFEVADPSVGGSRTLIRPEDGSSVNAWVYGFGQGWTEDTTATLRRNDEVIAHGDVEVFSYSDDPDSQDLEIELTIPAEVEDGLATLRLTTGATSVDHDVRLSGPRVAVWYEGSWDGEPAFIEGWPVGFTLTEPTKISLADRDGDPVPVEVLYVDPEDGYFAVTPEEELADETYTVTVESGGATYQGRFHATDWWPEFDVDPDTLESDPAATDLQLTLPGGDLGPDLLSDIESWEPMTGGSQIAAPNPTRLDRERAVQPVPAGVPDAFYDIYLDDGDIDAYAGLTVGDPTWPTLHVTPDHVASGNPTPYELELEADGFVFSGPTTASLWRVLVDDDEWEWEWVEVPDALADLEIVDDTHASVTVVEDLEDGWYEVVLDVDGGWFFGLLEVGEGGEVAPRREPRWAEGSQLVASNLTPTSVSLAWPAATSNAGPVTYQLLRDGDPVAAPTTELSTTVTGLQPQTRYRFAVRATDARGTVSTTVLRTQVRTPRVGPPTRPGPNPPTCADAGRGPRFPDIRGSVHEDAIRCSAGLGLVVGKQDGRFDPNGSLTRGQLASIVLRALEASELTLRGQASGFRDIAGSPHTTAIRKLTAAGIIQGKSPTRFDPNAAVTRGQLVSILDRASRELLAPYPAASGPRFTDIAGSPHAGAIDRLSAAEVVKGLRGGQRFGPNQDVTRAQAAALATRWLEDQAARLN